MPLFSCPFAALAASNALPGLKWHTTKLLGVEGASKFGLRAYKKQVGELSTIEGDKKASRRRKDELPQGQGPSKQDRKQKPVEDIVFTLEIGKTSSRNKRDTEEPSSQQETGGKLENGKSSTSSKPEDKNSAAEVKASGVYVETASRGERFMEEQKARDEELAKKQQAKRERKKKVKTQAKLKSLEPCCYGCGAPLQYTDEGSPGYIDEETYMLKKRHHQLRKSVLCVRCKMLCHGKLIPAVGGYGIYGREKGFVTAEELRAQLAHIRDEKVLVLKLVDIVDFSGSFITRVRDLVGANPIVLVATKVDLLPEETDLAAVGDWIVETTLRKKLNVISIHLTSAKYSMGIANIAKEIQRERQGRDVYILGAANVGKSAFIDALLKEMASRDPVAQAARRHRPTQSVLPGTTVGPISIDAFFSGGCIYDTPGVHLHHRIETAISPDDLPALFPGRRLRGYVVSPILERKGHDSLFSYALQQAENSEPIKNVKDLSGLSLFWGGIARIDVLKAPKNTRLTFFGSSAIRVHRVPTPEADAFYENELGKTLTPPGEERAVAWPGLHSRNKYTLEYDDSKPVGDIAISGLGWMSIDFLQKLDKAEDEMTREDSDKHNLELQVWVPKGIEVFLRPSIPVGPKVSTWYLYTELTEEQEKTRPRLYYSNYRDK